MTAADGLMAQRFLLPADAQRLVAAARARGVGGGR